jgi:sulfur relay (sulfurtransferase) DsrC/TusE family protein
LWSKHLLPENLDPIVDALRSGDDDFAAHLMRLGVPVKEDIVDMLAELIDWSLKENKVDVVAIVIKFLQSHNLVEKFVHMKIKEESILVRTARVEDPSNFVLNFLLEHVRILTFVKHEFAKFNHSPDHYVAFNQ